MENNIQKIVGRFKLLVDVEPDETGLVEILNQIKKGKKEGRFFGTVELDEKAHPVDNRDDAIPNK